MLDSFRGRFEFIHELSPSVSVLFNARGPRTYNDIFNTIIQHKQCAVINRKKEYLNSAVFFTASPNCILFYRTSSVTID
jgi:hypothetical protein